MLPIMMARGGLTGAVVALCLLVGLAAQAQVCGNGVVEAGGSGGVPPTRRASPAGAAK